MSVIRSQEEHTGLIGRAARQMARFSARFSKKVEPSELELLANAREFDLFFADDSRQRTPLRPGMGPLVGIGGLDVSGPAVGSLAAAVEGACVRVGFPPNQEFKWSPGRELWMHDNLVEGVRESFFLDVIKQLDDHEVTVFVVVRDTECVSATGAPTPEADATTMFLERVHHLCVHNYACGMVVVDRPSGGRGDEDKFLRACLETIREGTTYVNMQHIVHNIVSTPSKLSRLLQAADLVTGACVSHVAGEIKYSAPVFEALKPLFYTDQNRIGGYGLKIHPAFRYLNLYHWLLGDSHFWRGALGTPLPFAGRLYYSGPFVP